MTLATIEIQVDERAARVYTEASDEEREKLQSLLSIWLQEFDEASDDLLPLMEEIGERASERGMTPEVLETLLRDE